MKKNLDNLFIFIIPIIILAILIKIYSPWFFSSLITAGDWPYFSHKMTQDWPIFAPFWTRQGGIGLGGVNPDFPIFSYQYFSVGFFTNLLRIPWPIVYKLSWFGLFLFLSFISSLFLYKIVRPKSAYWEQFLAAFIYLVNSYILMIAGGGQIGIALAYSVTPLVVASLIVAQQSLKDSSIRHIVRLGLLVGLVYAFQILFEPRTSYVTGLILFPLFLFRVFLIKGVYLTKRIVFWGTMALVVFLLHSYWIIPFFIFHLLSVPEGITSSVGFTFFSFADFSHAFAFLQPNWPENIFGKVSFLRPEFLIYPIVAFSGLFFEKARKNVLFLFFALLVLVFTFLAKGTTDPFGFVNLWIFSHVPGMNVFRDPTKFYYFIALGYSIMIPYGLSVVAEGKWFRSQGKKLAFILAVFLLLVFPVRDALFGKLAGTFITAKVPGEYLQLENFLSPQPQFFRTLWIPDQSRFRFVSETHPIMIGETFFKTASQSAIENQLESLSTKQRLQDYSIKYIIVPDDTQTEIFLTDRKYDDRKRQELLQSLDDLPYLRKQSIGKIILYEAPIVNDYMYLSSGKVDYQKIGNSQYRLTINSSQSTKLFLSEAYNKNWIIKLPGKTISSVKTTEGFNSFHLPKGKYQVTLSFFPDELRNYFYVFSIASLIGVVVLIILLR